LIYVLLTNVEPDYWFKEILKKEGFLNNFKKEKQFESLIEKEKIIRDSDCSHHEQMSHAFWVRSQSKHNKQYLVTCHRTNFLTCNFPWSICGNICKHAIKVGWLSSHLMASNQLLNHQSITNSYNEPPNQLLNHQSTTNSYNDPPNQLLNHQSIIDSYHDPPKINIEAISDLSENANTFAMDSYNVDINVEGIELAKED